MTLTASQSGAATFYLLSTQDFTLPMTIGLELQRLPQVVSTCLIPSSCSAEGRGAAFNLILGKKLPGNREPWFFSFLLSEA